MNSWDKYELDDYAKMFFDNEVIRNADDLKSKFEMSYKELHTKLELVEKAVRHVTYNGWDDIKYIWNLAGFILTTSLDLKIYGENLVFLSGYGKKELQIKNLCVLIYETCEDIEQLLGKRFFDICERLEISNGNIEELKQIKKSLSLFKNEHQSSLKSIRKIIGAHRDHDFLAQIDVIKSLSDTSFISVVTKFDGIVNNISGPLQRIINESTDKFINKMI